MCTWNRLLDQSYSVFFSLASIYTPPVFILLCYLRIFLFVYGAEKRSSATVVGKRSSDGGGGGGDKKTIRAAKSLFFSFAFVSQLSRILIFQKAFVHNLAITILNIYI